MVTEKIASSEQRTMSDLAKIIRIYGIDRISFITYLAPKGCECGYEGVFLVIQIKEWGDPYVTKQSDKLAARERVSAGRHSP
jgi:hypothetical protein